MNNKLMGTLLALCIPLTAFSLPQQPGTSSHQDKGQKIERMTKELGLSEDQKTKVGAIFDKEKMKFKALHEEKRARLQGVLTLGQMTKLAALHQQHRQQFSRGESHDHPQ